MTALNVLLVVFIIMFGVRWKFPQVKTSSTYWLLDAVLWLAFTALYAANPMGLPTVFAIFFTFLGALNTATSTISFYRVSRNKEATKV